MTFMVEKSENSKVLNIKDSVFRVIGRTDGVIALEFVRNYRDPNAGPVGSTVLVESLGEYELIAE